MHGVLGNMGRTRKHGARYKSGKLKPQPQINYRKMAGEQPHRRDLPNDTKLRAEGFNELGRLFLKGLITEPEYLAGQEFARVTAMYRATINPPRALAGAGGGYVCNPEPCRDNPENCNCAHRRLAYTVLHDVLSEAGHRVLIAVKHVVIEDKHPAAEYRLLAIYGLMRLAKHLGLTERGKSGNYRNRQ